MSASSKRPRGRPRLPESEKGVGVGVWLKADVYDALIHRARVEGESVSSVLRKDLELVNSWRQRKRDGRP